MLKKLSRVQRSTLEFIRDNPAVTYRGIGEGVGASLNGTYMAVAHLLGWGLISEGDCPTCGRNMWTVTELGKQALNSQKVSA